MTNPDEKPQNPPEFGGFAPQIVIELSFVEIGVEAPASPIISEWGRMTLDLSTTNMDPEYMLEAFDINIQTSETRVLDRHSLRFEVENVGPAGEANEFDYVVTLDYPFFYDTTQGNLLFDWTSDGITGSPYG